MSKTQRKPRPNELKAQTIKTNIEKLKSESGKTEAELRRLAQDALEKGYDASRVDGPLDGDPDQCRLYTSLSAHFHSTTGKFTDIPSLVKHAKTESQRQYKQWEAYSNFALRIRQHQFLRGVKEFVFFELLSPYTYFAISHRNFKVFQYIAQEFDHDVAKQAEGAAAPVPNVLIVTEENVEQFLNRPALALFKKHGFQVFVMLSGNRSIHLQCFFDRWIPLAESAQFRDLLKVCVRGLKADCSNLTSTMRVAGFYHQRGAADGFTVESLSRFLGLKTQTENWEFLCNAPRSTFSLRAVAALRSDLLEAGFLPPEPAAPTKGGGGPDPEHLSVIDDILDDSSGLPAAMQSLCSAAEESASAHLQAPAGVADPAQAEPALQMESSNGKAPAKRAKSARLKGNRRTLSQAELHEILENGIPANRSWDLLTQTHLCAQASLLLGKETALNRLISAIQDKSPDNSKIEDRLKKLHEQFQTLSDKSASSIPRYSSNQIELLEKASKKALNSLLNQKSRRRKPIVLQSLLEYIIELFKKEMNPVYIGTQAVAAHLELGNKMSASRALNTFCVHSRNPTPAFPLFVCSKEHFHAFSIGKASFQSKVREYSLNLDYLGTFSS